MNLKKIVAHELTRMNTNFRPKQLCGARFRDWEGLKIPPCSGPKSHRCHNVPFRRLRFATGQVTWWQAWVLGWLYPSFGAGRWGGLEDSALLRSEVASLP